jgi:hypothetical protein
VSARYSGARGPVEVTVGRAGTVAADTPVEVAIELRPRVGCTALIDRVRGLDGVTVVGFPERRHGGCALGSVVSHSVTVEVPRGAAGYLVVDVTLVDGARSYHSSTPFAFRTPEAAHSRAPMGVLRRDHRGRPVMVLPAQTAPAPR